MTSNSKKACFSLDKVLEEMPEHLRVANLFQIGGGLWQANVRRRNPDQKGDWGYDFARADTAAEAMMAAIKKATK